MTILVVDDEPIILEGEAALLRRCAPEAEVFAFGTAEEALNYVKLHTVDVAFLDMEMPRMNGVTLARKMKLENPRLNIIFATAYRKYFEAALNMHASGYLLKPLREERVVEELNNLRFPVESAERGLYVRCFGSFEMFYDGVPVQFRYFKTKELFAYLIDRCGAVVTKDELVTVLWGGETEKDNYYKQVQKDLTDMLRSFDLKHILVKPRGGIGLLMKDIACDYFDWRKGLPRGLSAYHGEYMRQYDWAESTLLHLEGKNELWTL